MSVGELNFTVDRGDSGEIRLFSDDHVFTVNMLYEHHEGRYCKATFRCDFGSMLLLLRDMADNDECLMVMVSDDDNKNDIIWLEVGGKGFIDKIELYYPL